MLQTTAKLQFCKEIKRQKTHNGGYSQVVTHPTTNPPISRLCMAERKGCPVLCELWSLTRQDHHQNRPLLSAFFFHVPRSKTIAASTCTTALPHTSPLVAAKCDLRQDFDGGAREEILGVYWSRRILRMPVPSYKYNKRSCACVCRRSSQ